MSITDPMEIVDPQEELRRERVAHGIPADGSVNGRSIMDQMDSAPESDEDGDFPEELFQLDQGRRISASDFGRLIPPNTPVEYRVKFEGTSLKGGSQMGILPFNDPEMNLIMSVRQSKVDPVASYDEDGRLTKVVVNVYFKPRTVHHADSFEGRALLGE